jgi:GT2 family glycosyltransferase
MTEPAFGSPPPAPSGQSASTPGSIVIAGMHRSGTSLTASLLARLGVVLGDRLVPPDRANPKGYFEDFDIVRFHQRAFARLLPGKPAGHADWGWTPEAEVTAGQLAPWRREAQALVQARMQSGTLWGFKDPRATIVLDFWQPLFPNPVYVAVYRSPTLVADSMQRLAAPVFLRHPEYAWPIWRLYNQRLIDFIRRHRERCLVLNIDALPQQLHRIPQLLHDHLGLTVTQSDLSGLFDPQLLRPKSRLWHREQLSRVVYDECYSVYDQLEALADLPDKTASRPEPYHSPLLAATGRSLVSPELSIVIPTCNDAALLVEALASVEQCQPRDCEVLVLDDGSSDPESLRVLERLKSVGYTVLRQPNAGLSAARNALIRRARGRLILPVDADNRLLPGFIEQARKALAADPGLAIVYGDRKLFGAASETLRVPDFDLARMVDQNFIDACAIFRRKVWEDVGGFDEGLRGFEDWEFWLHAGQRSWRFAHLPEAQFEYRVRPGSLLSHCNTRRGRWRFRRHLLRKHPDLLTRLLPQPLRKFVSDRSPPADSAVGPSGLARLLLNTYWLWTWFRPRWAGSATPAVRQHAESATNDLPNGEAD